MAEIVHVGGRRKKLLIRHRVGLSSFGVVTFQREPRTDRVELFLSGTACGHSSLGKMSEESFVQKSYVNYQQNPSVMKQQQWYSQE